MPRTLDPGFMYFAGYVKAGIFHKHGFMVTVNIVQADKGRPSYFSAQEKDGDRWILFKSAQPVSMGEAADALIGAPLENWSTGPAGDDAAIEYAPQTPAFV